MYHDFMHNIGRHRGHGGGGHGGRRGGFRGRGGPAFYDQGFLYSDAYFDERPIIIIDSLALKKKDAAQEDMKGVDSVRSGYDIVADLMGVAKTKVKARSKGPIVFSDRRAYETFAKMYPNSGAKFLAPLPGDEVRTKLLPTIQACYQMETKRNPSLRGKVNVSFDIAPDGHVTNIAIIEDTLRTPRLTNCIKNLIKNNVFAQGGTSANFPFLFA